MAEIFLNFPLHLPDQNSGKMFSKISSFTPHFLFKLHSGRWKQEMDVFLFETVWASDFSK